MHPSFLLFLSLLLSSFKRARKKTPFTCSRGPHRDLVVPLGHRDGIPGEAWRTAKKKSRGEEEEEEESDEGIDPRARASQPRPRRGVGVRDRDAPPEDLEHVARRGCPGDRSGASSSVFALGTKGSASALSLSPASCFLRRRIPCSSSSSSSPSLPFFIFAARLEQRVPPHDQPLLQARVHNLLLDDVGGVVLEVEAELDLADAEAVRRRRRQREKEEKEAEATKEKKREEGSRSAASSPFRLQARGAGGHGLAEPPAVSEDDPGVGDVARDRERRRGRGSGFGRSGYGGVPPLPPPPLPPSSPSWPLLGSLAPRPRAPSATERLDVGAPVGEDEGLGLEEGGGLGLDCFLGR